MAERGPKHHSKEGSHRSASPDPPSGPGSARPSSRFDVPPSSIGPPHGLQGPPMMIEKLASQHAEIQRLLTENQRLAVTHVALRQELAAAQQEIRRVHEGRTAVDTEKEQRLAITQVALRQELADAKHEVHRLQEAITAIRAEKDQHIRAAVEKVAQMDMELKATEAFKGDFEKIRYEREELAARFEQLTGEVKKLPLKDGEIASLKAEVDELRQKHQQARMDFELQKKISFERLEEKQAMEKNVFTMAREVEKLRMELANAERRAYAAALASSGGTTPALHNSMPLVGAYENNYGAQQEVLKHGQNVNRPENKGTVEAAKYGAGMEDFKPGMQASEDPLSKPTANADPAGEWSKHASSNGKPFYYNTVTGATQWDKPLAVAGADALALHQRQLQQAQGQTAHDLRPEFASLQQPQSQPQPLQQQQLPPTQQQQQPPQQPISGATMPQGPQLQAQQANFGINLLVLGVFEGVSDRDLAGLFHPYGTVLNAKVVMDEATGQGKGYGIVSMENPQAAEAAVAALNGMFILGRRIKIEIQHREQGPSHQGYAEPLMQQSPMQGSVGPLRWHHRGAPPGRWPY